MPATQWSVVLAGGVGSRFWPLSTPERPKQLLPLVDDRSLLLNTLDRLAPLTPRERTLVLTNASLAPLIAAAIPDIPNENIIAEPRPAGTAAALAYAAILIQRRGGDDSVMLCVHADWAIADPEGFRATLTRAVTVAERQHGLVTVGVVPSRPDPGFGYIEPGANEGDSVSRVARFVEKPTRERAAEMCQAGYLWNSGIFVWRCTDFLDEVRALTPEVAPALAQLTGNPSDMETFFQKARSISVDVGVLERSNRLFVIPGDFGWDDVGTWAALRRVRSADAHGNVTSGPSYAIEAHGNVVHADGNTVVLYGVSDLVVVTRNGLTLVTTVEKSADLKTLVEALPAQIQSPE
jgi:mannose-1-phosphate guanylyltransferase